jgi:hypothetical protein
MSSPVLKILLGARTLIAFPAHWTQHALARDIERNPMVPDDPRAVCFCADGALLKAAGTTSLQSGLPKQDDHYADYVRAVSAVEIATRQLFDIESYIEVNDDEVLDIEGGHAAVLRIFDRAIHNEEPDHG